MSDPRSGHRAENEQNKTENVERTEANTAWARSFRHTRQPKEGYSDKTYVEPHSDTNPHFPTAPKDAPMWATQQGMREPPGHDALESAAVAMRITIPETYDTHIFLVLRKPP